MMHAALKPHRPHRAARQGFTLIEVMLSLFIMGIMMLAIGSVMVNGVRAWDTGHGTSEIFQTARIAQDVVIHDLDNIVYLTESDYNNAFRQQLQQQVAAVMNGNEPELDKISPPLDLSFRGQDGGSTDQLSFVRSYHPRFAGDLATWGLRRVSFYVRDGVLYRKEEDPYGMRAPLNDTESTVDADGNPLADDVLVRRQLEALYYVQDPSAEDQKAQTGGGEKEDTETPLPNQVRVEEPICAGVEIFNVTYGHFQDDKWPEEKSWDSKANDYRNPISDEELDILLDQNQFKQQSNDEGDNGDSAINNIMRPTVPNDLPGYVAIQVGVRMPGDEGGNAKKKKAKGRLRSFTIFHSLPLAMENDVLITEENKTRPR